MIYVMILMFVSHDVYNKGNVHTTEYQFSSMEECDSVKNHLIDIMATDEALKNVKTSAYCFEKNSVSSNFK